jgi:hypothetical protein
MSSGIGGSKQVLYSSFSRDGPPFIFHSSLVTVAPLTFLSTQHIRPKHTDVGCTHSSYQNTSLYTFEQENQHIFSLSFRGYRYQSAMQKSHQQCLAPKPILDLTSPAFGNCYMRLTLSPSSYPSRSAEFRNKTTRRVFNIGTILKPHPSREGLNGGISHPYNLQE